MLALPVFSIIVQGETVRKLYRNTTHLKKLFNIKVCKVKINFISFSRTLVKYVCWYQNYVQALKLS